jgi:3(or 17)beta-hydroxysteroid dehydrogenase
MGRVQGKVSLVTGAASGLGLADAEALAAEGSTVVLTDLSEAPGEAAAARIGRGAIFLKHDVRSESEWADVIATVEQRFGGLDVLVNNAGIVHTASVEDTSLEDFRRVNAIMSEGVFLGCKHAIPLMAKSGGGSIVNVSSIAGILGYPKVFAYAAAKGAVRSMTKSVAIHCQEQGYKIRCNSIHPGLIETPLIRERFGRTDAAEIPPGVLPKGSPGAPVDVANLVLYLASDESRFITGAEFIIDNGVTVTP